MIHELFHFVWVRLSNLKRRTWEMILTKEMHFAAQGELGWSAEWRKAKLKAVDVEQRKQVWRTYVCESFCDTAAWLYASLRRHDEFTLALPARRTRKTWFRRNFQPNGEGSSIKV